MKNENGAFMNAEEPKEPSFSDQEFDDLLFASNATHQNERITLVARQYVEHSYTGDEFTTGEVVLNKDLEDRIDELQAVYASGGFYDDLGAYYIAQKQAFSEQLAEKDMRFILLETLCTKDASPEKMAARQEYLYAYISQYKIDPSWNSVVSELVDADESRLSINDAVSIGNLVRRSRQTSRQRIMDTILNEAGGEEYLMITGSLQDFSQIETATNAWSAAAVMHLPDAFNGLDEEYREHNRAILTASLDRTEMTDEQKSVTTTELSWLL